MSDGAVGNLFRRRMLVGAVLASVLLTNATGAPAATATPADEPGVSRFVEEWAGTRVGAAGGLGATGGDADSLDEAPYSAGDVAWAQSQKRLGDIAWRIQESFREDFAFAYFSQNDVMTIGFRSVIPADARAVIEGSGPGFVIAENVGFDAAEYEAEAERIARSVAALSGSGVQIQVGPTPHKGNGSITVTTITDNGVGLSEPALRRVLITAGKSFSLNFETAQGAVKTAGYNRAAGTWLLNSAGQGMCTSGFVAKSTSNADLGILTAGHCINDLRFWNSNSGEHFWLTYRGGQWGLGGDAQFNRSPVMMDAWFHVSSTQGRPVLEVRDAFWGERVCRFGKTTGGERCGTVVGTNQIILTDGTTYTGKLTLMDGGAVLPGDSGGSVYGGNTAMGILHGWSGDRTYFTAISAAQAITGTRVCLDPVCG